MSSSSASSSGSSLEAVEDVLRFTMGSPSKATVVIASTLVQEALRSDSIAVGEHLCEGLYYIDRDPLRAFYTIDVDQHVVEIVNIKEV